MNTNQGTNLARNHIDIGRACMPLIRLLMQDGLCWAHREQIAEAIQNNLRIYADHQAEQRHLSGQNADAAMVRKIEQAYAKAGLA